MGVQESILKAEISEMIPPEQRGTAFGTFNTAFGLFWFAGSVVMGYLYDLSVKGLIIFSIAMQLIAVLIIYYLIRLQTKNVQ